MPTLLIALTVGLAFIIAYHTYGRWLANKIFNLSDSATCPSEKLRDDVDYVPTAKPIIFGHHFTSIAGTGPIVGPAIGVMWGWLPALLWVAFGAIFIGAVHDFGSLVVSLRHNGQTVGDVAGRVLNKRVRLLFLFVLFFALTVVLAIFGLVIAAVFKQYPAAIFPCLIQIPIAIIIGSYLHKKGVNILIPSIIALAVMYICVIFGNVGWLGTFNATLASWSIITWVIVLLLYSYVASVLPVWLLLQPRDYINSLQLITALGLIVVGLAVAAIFGGAPPTPDAARPTLEIVAPLYDFSPQGAPMVFPFLFITIACGAISGFHCLVSSGTTSKQLKCETDARFVGYGSMLTEGFLATLVICACIAGLGLGIAASDGSIATGADAWAERYASWSAASGLAAKVGAFVDGAANFLKAMNIPGGVAVAIMGVLVASFAGTTLDTACRLQRYVVQELAATFLPSIGKHDCCECGYDLTGNVTGKCSECGWQIDPQKMGSTQGYDSRKPLSMNPITWLRNKHGATIFAILIALVVAAMPAPGNTTAIANYSLSDAMFNGYTTVGQGGQITHLGTYMQDPGVYATWHWLKQFGGKGGLILWPLFGATNQLLAGLAFLVVAFYLWRRKKPVFFIVLPMLFMLLMPAWAMIISLPGWINADNPNIPIIVIGIATLALEAWMIVEAIILWPKVRGILESQPNSDSIEVLPVTDSTNC